MGCFQAIIQIDKCWRLWHICPDSTGLEVISHHRGNFSNWPSAILQNESTVPENSGVVTGLTFNTCSIEHFLFRSGIGLFVQFACTADTSPLCLVKFLEERGDGVFPQSCWALPKSAGWGRQQKGEESRLGNRLLQKVWLEQIHKKSQMWW